jgi:hypothetical protein
MRKAKKTPLITELDEEDKLHIMEVFMETVAPKLRRLQARMGTIGCDFAGERYANWAVRFRESGSDFEIVAFEYDEDACGLDLDL